MTVEAQDILTDFYSGKSMYIAVTVSDSDGNNLDLSGGEVVYTIYDDKGIICLHKSTISGITLSGTNDHIATVAIAPKDTINLKGLYRHEMTFVDDSGREVTVMRGKVRIFESKARRQRQFTKLAYMEVE